MATLLLKGDLGPLNEIQWGIVIPVPADIL